MRGLLPEQFWNMTFFEFRSWGKNATAQEELEWQRTSLIAAILANQNRSRNKKALSPDDFNPYSEKNSGNKDAREDVEKAMALAEEMKNKFKDV